MSPTDNPIYSLARFLMSLFVVLVLAWIDVSHHEQIPTIAYLLVGGLNGVDLYNLYKSKKE